MKKAILVLAACFLALGAFAAGGAAAADKLPKVIVLGSLSKVYEPVRFDHEKHLSIADGCEGCHHQHRAMQIKTCPDCHRYDPATFRKNVKIVMILPCKDCHMENERPGVSGQPNLKTAYHNACNKCHWGEVGSKNLAGCTEVCHAQKARAGGAGK